MTSRTMAERPARRSALAAVYRRGDLGAMAEGGPGVILSERRDLAILQVAACGEPYDEVSRRLAERIGLALPSKPNSAQTVADLAALWIGPGRALLIGPETKDLPTLLEAATAGVDAAVTELSHARTVLALAGPRVRELLAKGSGVDFHPCAFAAGACVQTGYGQFPVLLHALDDHPRVDLYVDRGLAVALWEELIERALEYGCRVSSPR